MPEMLQKTTLHCFCKWTSPSAVFSCLKPELKRDTSCLFKNVFIYFVNIYSFAFLSHNTSQVQPPSPHSNPYTKLKNQSMYTENLVLVQTTTGTQMVTSGSVSLYEPFLVDCGQCSSFFALLQSFILFFCGIFGALPIVWLLEPAPAIFFNQARLPVVG